MEGLYAHMLTLGLSNRYHIYLPCYISCYKCTKSLSLTSTNLAYLYQSEDRNGSCLLLWLAICAFWNVQLLIHSFDAKTVSLLRQFQHIYTFSLKNEHAVCIWFQGNLQIRLSFKLFKWNHLKQCLFKVVHGAGSVQQMICKNISTRLYKSESYVQWRNQLFMQYGLTWCYSEGSILEFHFINLWFSPSYGWCTIQALDLLHAQKTTSIHAVRTFSCSSSI